MAYEATVLRALEEVENALVAYAEVQQRRQSLSEATEAAQQAVELAQHKYQAGLTDFNNVLDGAAFAFFLSGTTGPKRGDRYLQPGSPV